jgi:phosphatidate cytidylyltransferase
MAPDEREGEFEDLFDDLDSFFEPEEAQPEASAGHGEQPQPGGTRPEGTGSGEGAAVQPEEEILPPGWREVGDLDLEADTGEHPPIEPWRTYQETEWHEEGKEAPQPELSEPPAAAQAGQLEPTEPATSAAAPSEPSEPATSAAAPDQPSGQPFEDGPGPDPHEAWRPEPTSEMSGDDWSRLREAIRDEDGEEEFDLLTEEPAEGETLFGYEDEQEVEDGEPALTFEDLRKAPPEYVDLPGAEAEGEDQDLVGVARSQMAGPEDQGQPLRSEPAMAEVEAAADQLARQFGESPPTSERGPSAAPAGVDSDDDLLADLHPPGPRTIKVDPERFTGPTWEEPSSRGLRVEPVASRYAERNLPAAVISAAFLVAAAIISIALSKVAFAIVAGVVVLIGQAELYAAMQRRGAQPATALGLVMGAVVLGAAYLRGEQAMLFVLPLALLLSFLWYMVAPPKVREGLLSNIGATMLGIIYVPFLAGYVLIMLSVASGRALVLVVLGLTFLYDVSAFVFGSFWGTRPLAPTISPKKTVEGLAGASVVTFAISLVVVASVHPLATWTRAAVLGILVDVFAPLGDLAESAIKRDLGVKDMGSIMPGHGGVLDRIDSVLFVAPAVFYFLRVIF